MCLCPAYSLSGHEAPFGAYVTAQYNSVQYCHVCIDYCLCDIIHNCFLPSLSQTDKWKLMPLRHIELTFCCDSTMLSWPRRRRTLTTPALSETWRQHTRGQGQAPSSVQHSYLLPRNLPSDSPCDDPAASTHHKHQHTRIKFSAYTTSACNDRFRVSLQMSVLCR